jgi:hypothetical protein
LVFVPEVEVDFSLAVQADVTAAAVAHCFGWEVAEGR